MLDKFPMSAQDVDFCRPRVPYPCGRLGPQPAAQVPRKRQGLFADLLYIPAWHFPAVK
jgi:hypothetical protein